MDVRFTAAQKLFSKIGTTGITFIGITTFAWWLDPSTLGIYFLFESVVGIVGQLSNLSIGFAMEKRMSEAEEKGDLFVTGLSISLILLIFVSALVLIFSGLINKYIDMNISILIIISLFVKRFEMLSKHTLKGELRVGETALVDLISRLGWLIAGLGFLLHGTNQLGLIYATIVGHTSGLILGWYKMSVPIGRPTIKDARSLFQFARYSYVGSLAGNIYNWLDTVILGLFVSSALIGGYGMGWRITQATILVGTVVGNTVFPQVSAWNTSRDMDKIESLFSPALFAPLIVILPATAGIAMLSEPILAILFGKGYAIAALAFVILGFGMIPQSIVFILNRFLLGVDRPDRTMYSELAMISTNVVLNFILIWLFGLVGAAIATVAAITVNVILHAYFLSEIINIKLPIEKILWCLLATSVMTIALSTVNHYLSIQNYIDLFGIITFGAFIYFGLVLLHSGIRNSAKDLTQHLINR
jgi:O-antigen/teichoic acid export membrane protein